MESKINKEVTMYNVMKHYEGKFEEFLEGELRYPDTIDNNLRFCILHEMIRQKPEIEKVGNFEKLHEFYLKNMESVGKTLLIKE